MYFRRSGSAEATGRDREGTRGRSSVRCRRLRNRYRRSKNKGRKRRGEGTTIVGGGRECRRGGRVETAERRNTSEDNGKCRRKAKRRIKEKKV